MNKKFYLWGIGGIGKRLLPKLAKHGMIAGVTDSNIKKIGMTISGFTVESVERTLLSGGGIIFSFFGHNPEAKILNERGIPFYSISDFYTEWFWNVRNENALSFLDLPITSRCTLNCKYCMQYLPIRDQRQDIPFSQISLWWDCLVKHFPYIMEVSIMGGEPFLHPFLGEIVEYIEMSTDISIVVTTNGTVMPNDQTIEKLKKHNVFVSISDYSVSLPYLADRINEFENRLKESGIRVERKTHLWIDQGRFKKSINTESTDCARSHFQLSDNKLWYCTLQAAGNKANLCLAEKGVDYIDLNSEYSPLDLYRFSNSKTKTTVCNLCSSRERQSVPVAEQM